MKPEAVVPFTLRSALRRHDAFSITLCEPLDKRIIRSFMPNGTVRLVNAVFYAHHGVMQEEHRIGGRYEVDVSIDLDLEEAARTDDLSETVDYEKVYRLVEEIVTRNRFYLIEKLAYLIAREVLKTYPRVHAVEVAVRKPNPPVGGTADHAEAIIRLP